MRLRRIILVALFAAALPQMSIAADHAVDQDRAERMLAAKRLFAPNEAPIYQGQSSDIASLQRHEKRGVRKSAARRMNAAAFSKDGNTYSMLTFASFQGEKHYLDPARVYEIAPGITGWIGVVLDETGIEVGTARFEVYSTGRVSGAVRVNSVFKLQIEPVPGGNQSDIVELPLIVAGKPIHGQRNMTDEDLEREQENWRDRLGSEEFAEHREQQRLAIEAASEQQKSAEKSEDN
jgi:hypothetical protein